MRVVPFHEKKKRGCDYCTDKKVTRDHGCLRTACPHDACPHNALDKYETYEEFMASEDSKILVDGFFHTTASCYELTNGNATVKQIYGGGGSKELF
jgi:hypothetical protein